MKPFFSLALAGIALVFAIQGQTPTPARVRPIQTLAGKANSIEGTVSGRREQIEYPCQSQTGAGCSPYDTYVDGSLVQRIVPPPPTSASPWKRLIYCNAPNIGCGGTLTVNQTDFILPTGCVDPASLLVVRNAAIYFPPTDITLPTGTTVRFPWGIQDPAQEKVIILCQ